MSQTRTQSVDGIAVLIGIFLNHGEYNHVIEDAAKIICQLISKHKDSLVKVDQDGVPNYNLPYDKIADEIYQHKAKIDFETLDVFVNTIYPYIELNIDPQVVVSYRKLTRHILLAVRQKNFINLVAIEARAIADTASVTAESAAKLAEETEREVKNSVVSYITILGIFATIIFALFGAVNLISAVNSLLASANRPKLTTILLLTSLLVMAISTLLIMLMSWLIEIKGLGEAKWRDRIYLRVYFCLLGVCSIISVVAIIKLI